MIRDCIPYTLAWVVGEVLVNALDRLGTGLVAVSQAQLCLGQSIGPSLSSTASGETFSLT